MISSLFNRCSTLIKRLLRQRKAFDPELIRISPTSIQFHRAAKSVDLGDELREVLNRAAVISTEYRHIFIGTTHLLLALLERDCAATAVMRRLGCRPETIHTYLVQIIRASSETEILDNVFPQPPPTRRAIARAIDEARRMQSDQVGTEHLLLGIMRAGYLDGMRRVLYDHGLRVRPLRAAIRASPTGAHDTRRGHLDSQGNTDHDPSP